VGSVHTIWPVEHFTSRMARVSTRDCGQLGTTKSSVLPGEQVKVSPSEISLLQLANTHIETLRTTYLIKSDLFVRSIRQKPLTQCEYRSIIIKEMEHRAEQRFSAYL
jgi:hypothetical protein